MSTLPEAESSDDTAPPVPRTLRRARRGKLVGGVARGLANRYDADPLIFRVLFVILSFVWGLGAAVYLALWAFLPRPDEAGGLDDDDRAPVSTSHRLTITLVLGVIIAAILIVVLATGHNPGRPGPGLALLWLVFLIAMAVVALRTSARRLTVRRFFALIVLVVISFFILTTGAVLAFLNSTGTPLMGGNGVHAWQPVNVSEVSHHYVTEFGTRRYQS